VNDCIIQILTLRCFGTRLSLNKWNKLRSIQSFESVTDARERTKENERKIQVGEKKSKTCVGKHSSYDWNKIGLEQEVKNLTNCYCK